MAVKQHSSVGNATASAHPTEKSILVEVEMLRSYFDTSARTQFRFPFTQGIEACPEVSKGANGKRNF
jgi:hypothetical protein